MKQGREKADISHNAAKSAVFGDCRGWPICLHGFVIMQGNTSNVLNVCFEKVIGALCAIGCRKQCTDRLRTCVHAAEVNGCSQRVFTGSVV